MDSGPEIVDSGVVRCFIGYCNAVVLIVFMGPLCALPVPYGMSCWSPLRPTRDKTSARQLLEVRSSSRIALLERISSRRYDTIARRQGHLLHKLRTP